MKQPRISTKKRTSITKLVETMILSSRLMAVGRGGRTLMGPLLVINLVVCLIVLGLAGWSLDKYIDGEQNHPRISPHLFQISFFIK